MRLVSNEGKRELLTEEVQEIIGKRLHWFIRKGNILILLLMLTILFFSWQIEYPETIKASAKIYSSNQPKLVTAKLSGHLSRLFVSDQQLVKQNQYLACIESTANPEEVILLNLWVDSTINNLSQNIPAKYQIPDPPYLSSLGEIQQDYQILLVAIQKLRDQLPGGILKQKQLAIAADLVNLQNLERINEIQKQFQIQDRQLKEKEYLAYDSLAKDKVIAPLELNQFKSQLLLKDQSLEQLNTQRINYELSNSGKQKELIDLKKQLLVNQQDYTTAIFSLKSTIENWLSLHVCIAPEDGKVVFASPLHENILLDSDQPLFNVISKQIEFYAELLLPQAGMGKLIIGQKVLINVDGYPSSEFGRIEGFVSSIPEISSKEDKFLVRVRLSPTLQTSTGHYIQFRNGLTAGAIVLTGRNRLLNKMLGKLKL